LQEELKTVPDKNWPAVFRALKHRQFRAFWIGVLVSAVGTWMQIVAQSLLVLRLSHGSALALGFVSLAQATAFFIFALVGGGFADRVDRRRLLIFTQFSLMLLAATLGFLTIAQVVTVPVIAALAFVSGVILSFDQPARAALVSTLVPQTDLLNAISLQSAVFNAASIAGPALAGLVVNWVGLATDFFLNALSFTGVLFALTFVVRGSSLPRRRDKLIAQIREALVSVHGDPVILSALVTYGMLLFAGPSLPLLLPVLALSRLHVGPATLGVLFSAAGVGAVLGALILGSLRAANVRFASGSLISWCAALAVAGTARSVPLSFCALVVLGASQSIVGSTTSTFLQTRVPVQQRGRVMSLNTLLLMGVRPLGDFPAGAAIAAIGAPLTALASATLVATTGLLVYANANRSSSKKAIDLE
jgi:predicted MFS family arabinose efflux permease